MRYSKQITIAAIIATFLLSLLTNFASVNVPQIFRENTALLWFVIVLLLIILIGLSILESTAKTANVRRVISEDRKSLMTNSYKYNAFISYSSYNLDWVKDKLVPELENRGFKVAIDYRDFVGGRFSVQEMERCVIESKHIIPIFTKDYFKSDWATLENVMATALDPAQKNRKLIPILLEDTVLPLRFTVINYIDLRDDAPREWEKLVESIMLE
ncbi:MAG: toll/interleukin-1 receptor domain-containing protein [Anaerolineae bacterium]|nr:toll/interleukin-1 receptor domain-containing protein [Anaerolineae bacterium]